VDVGGDMTIVQFIRVKENLEVDLLNLIDAKVMEFQKQTGVLVQAIEVVPYSYPKRLDGPMVSDVNVLPALQPYLAQEGEGND